MPDRAERAERERRLSTELAVAHDRARIAADVHDTVGHCVSLMVLQAGAPSATTWDALTRRAADTISAYGGQVVAELRELLQVMRGTGAWAPEPPATPPATDRPLAPLLGPVARRTARPTPTPTRG